MEMTNDGLPDGWAAAPFSAVTVDPTQREPGATERITYIDIGSVDRDTKTITEPQSLVGKDAPSRARKVIRTGDVLVSTVRPNLNAVAMVDPKYDGQFASTGFDVLRSPVLDPRWLFFSVRTPSFVERMTELVQGALYPAVRSKDVRAFVIPIAPLAEQKRIADKLEAVLGRVDACRARLDRVPDLLKRFRQSVLSAATSGRLTEDWREAHPLSEEWMKQVLGSLIADGPKNGLYKASTSYGQGTRILRIDNFYAGFISSWDGLKRLSVSESELEDFGLTVGDIVINRVNSMSHLGKSALVRELPEPCVFESNMMRIRVDVSQVAPEFCILVLTSPGGIVQLQQNAKQAVNQASINQGDVQSVAVAVPPLPEQEEIVRRVEALFAFADQIEARLTDTRAQVERLTPATLAKAFRGELVPQDPNDEPASMLLERVRNQAPAEGPARRERKARESVRDEMKIPATPVAKTAPLSLSVPAAVKATPAPLPSPPRIAPADTRETLVLVSDLDKDDLISVLRDVLTAHGPCDRETVIRHAAYSLGYQRTGKVVAQEFDNALRSAVRRRVVVNEGQELRLNRASIADMEAEDRAFMKDQFLAALSQHGRIWIEREEAFRVLAHWFGFRRTGSKIEDTAKSLINGLLRDQRLESQSTCIRRL